MEWFYCSNNECPACRTHCSSRRSLREDPNFDNLIGLLYSNIDKYEEEVISIYVLHNGLILFYLKKNGKNLISNVLTQELNLSEDTKKSMQVRLIS